MKQGLLLAGLAALLGACSWGIKLDSGGRNVHTAWDGNVAGCRSIGKITVSVLDHVGPMDRNDLKIRDELEVMARNEAAGMGADTVAPASEPHGGEQAWNAWACGRHTPAPAQAPATPPPGAAETYPIKH
jgi:hypothetical protein